MILSLNKKCKIHIHIKSFYYYYLCRDLKNIFLFLKKNNLNFLNSKIIFLPLKIKKFAVLKSPFVSKLDKEQFEIRVYKVLVILYLKNNFFINFFREKNIIKFNFNYIYYKLVYFYKIFN